MDEKQEMKVRIPFDYKDIKWKPSKFNKGNVKALAYLDVRAVRRRLNDVFGVDGWKTEMYRQDGVTFCKLSVWDGESQEWLYRTDSGGDSNVEAEKGAASDALKRAAINFGIGEYLYDIGDVWAERGEWNWTPAGEKQLEKAYAKFLTDLGYNSVEFFDYDRNNNNFGG